MVASAVIGGASSYMSSREQRKAAEKAGQATAGDLRSPALRQLGQQYVSALEPAVTDIKFGEDFGDVSVDLTQPEQQSLGFLQNFLGGDITQSDLFQAGRGQITETLGGGRFDPATGEFYKATRAGMDLATQEALDQARRGQAARGAFRSSGALRQEGDILTQSNIARQKLLADISERERERRATAGAQALNLAQFEANIPLTKAQAAQQLGSLERQNELQNLENEYKKWLNQRRELMSAFTSAGQASNYGQPLLLSPTTTVAPTGSGLAGGIGSILGGIGESGIVGQMFSGRGGTVGTSGTGGTSTASIQPIRSAGGQF
jgi:hypothetical protein